MWGLEILEMAGASSQNVGGRDDRGLRQGSSTEKPSQIGLVSMKEGVKLR